MKKQITLTFIIVTGCSSFRGQPEVLEPPIFEENRRDYTPEPRSNQESDRVNWREWQCCLDLCHKKVKSVAKEYQSKYIVCECRNGKKFRVAKIKNASRR